MAKFDFHILTDDKGVSDQEMAQWGLACMEAAIFINVSWLRKNPTYLGALACGLVKYDKAIKNLKSLVAPIATAPRLIAEGKGLCIDIVAYHVAALRIQDINAAPYIIERGNDIFHVVTEVFHDGKRFLVDPSLEIEQMGLAVELQPPCKLH